MGKIEEVQEALYSLREAVEERCDMIDSIQEEIGEFSDGGLEVTGDVLSKWSAGLYKAVRGIIREFQEG